MDHILAASEAAAWGGSPPVKPVAEAPSAETPAESFFSGKSQSGSTPTEPIEKPTGNGSSKL